MTKAQSIILTTSAQYNGIHYHKKEYEAKIVQHYTESWIPFSTLYWLCRCSNAHFLRYSMENAERMTRADDCSWSKSVCWHYSSGLTLLTDDSYDICDTDPNKSAYRTQATCMQCHEMTFPKQPKQNPHQVSNDVLSLDGEVELGDPELPGKQVLKSW